jgi:hypothetical protein
MKQIKNNIAKGKWLDGWRWWNITISIKRWPL